MSLKRLTNLREALNIARQRSVALHWEVKDVTQFKLDAEKERQAWVTVFKELNLLAEKIALLEESLQDAREL